MRPGGGVIGQLSLVDGNKMASVSTPVDSTQMTCSYCRQPSWPGRHPQLLPYCIACYCRLHGRHRRATGTQSSCVGASPVVANHARHASFSPESKSTAQPQQTTPVGLLQPSYSANISNLQDYAQPPQIICHRPNELHQVVSRAVRRYLPACAWASTGRQEAGLVAEQPPAHLHGFERLSCQISSFA